MLIFLSNMCKVLCRFQKCSENTEIILGLEDNDVWICCGNFSQSWEQNMWSVVKVLPNSPKISDLTKERCFLTQFVMD